MRAGSPHIDIQGPAAHMEIQGPAAPPGSERLRGGAEEPTRSEQQPPRARSAGGKAAGHAAAGGAQAAAELHEALAQGRAREGLTASEAWKLEQQKAHSLPGAPGWQQGQQPASELHQHRTQVVEVGGALITPTAPPAPSPSPTPPSTAPSTAPTPAPNGGGHIGGGNCAGVTGNGGGTEGGHSPEEVLALEELRAYIESLGGKMEAGWECNIRVRQGGRSSGAKDAYYRCPSTQRRFRSRREVALFHRLIPLPYRGNRELLYLDRPRPPPPHPKIIVRADREDSNTVSAGEGGAASDATISCGAKRKARRDDGGEGEGGGADEGGGGGGGGGGKDEATSQLASSPATCAGEEGG